MTKREDIQQRRLEVLEAEFRSLLPRSRSVRQGVGVCSVNMTVPTVAILLIVNTPIVPDESKLKCVFHRHFSRHPAPPALLPNSQHGLTAAHAVTILTSEILRCVFQYVDRTCTFGVRRDYCLAKPLAATWQQRPSLVQLNPTLYGSFFGHAFAP